jgi:hypothetical protein
MGVVVRLDVFVRGGLSRLALDYRAGLDSALRSVGPRKYALLPIRPHLSADGWATLGS